jgi:drug/metabolite transporter (DMT)-like permease
MGSSQLRIVAIVLGVLGILLIVFGSSAHNSLLQLLAVLCFVGAAVASFMMRRRVS